MRVSVESQTVVHVCVMCLCGRGKWVVECEVCRSSSTVRRTKRWWQQSGNVQTQDIFACLPFSWSAIASDAPQPFEQSKCLAQDEEEDQFKMDGFEWTSSFKLPGASRPRPLSLHPSLPSSSTPATKRGANKRRLQPNPFLVAPSLTGGCSQDRSQFCRSVHVRFLDSSFRSFVRPSLEGTRLWRHLPARDTEGGILVRLARIK